MKRRTFLGLLSALPFMAKAKEVKTVSIEAGTGFVDEGLYAPIVWKTRKEVEDIYQLGESSNEYLGSVSRDTFRKANRELSRLRAQAVEDLKFYNGDRWQE